MPFPPINLHQRISSSPGRELFGKKKTIVPPQPELTNKSGEERDSDREKLSTSWTAANLRNLGRKSQQQKNKSPAQRSVGGQETQAKGSWLTAPKAQDSRDSVSRSSSMEATTYRSSKQSSRSSLGKEEGEREIQFTLSLTPEAILVIQKRNLEKQMMAKQQKCCGSADLRHRKVFPSKKTHGASKGCLPVSKLESAEQDITTIVKISLLNDQYKYDDVEYEEEDGDVDETVVRKCKEWLKGVESAAAFGKVDRLSALPHLKGSFDNRITMRSKCKDIHQSSTLPSILDTYLPSVGFRKAEDEDKARPWRRRVKQSREPLVQGDIAPETDPDHEARARSQALLDQRHLEAYRNMHRLRDALYCRYAALLREKVHSQRLELKQRAEAARTKPENEVKQKQRKLAFSMLQHDDSYLRSLPKSSYYQNQLAWRGRLKTQQDLEDFCGSLNYNHGPTQLQRSLQEIRRRMVGSGSAPDLMTEQKTCGTPSIPITAVMDQLQVTCSSLPEGGPGAGGSSTDLLHPLSGSPEQEETEAMFPKMKVPTFATIQPRFLRNLQRKMPQLNIPEIPEKSRKAELHLGRLRQMYDISLTNMAASRRLLDRERHSLCCCWEEEEEEPGVQDLVSHVFPNIASKQEKTSQRVSQLPLHPERRNSQNGQPPSPRELSRVTSSHYCPESTFWDTAVGLCPNKTPEPLSMEDVCYQNPVRIIGRESKLWSNYVEDAGS